MPHIIFVCTGNICRSPMAEGFMMHKCKETGRHDLTVSSMGIHGLNDYPATEYAQKVCEKDGFDISSHKARYLVGDELQKAEEEFVHGTCSQKIRADLFPLAS